MTRVRPADETDFLWRIVRRSPMANSSLAEGAEIEELRGALPVCAAHPAVIPILRPLLDRGRVGENGAVRACRRGK